jgi:signal transduction histidine kinase/HAMP domain-containing protein
MRLSIRTKQVLGVTALVSVVVVGLSLHTLTQQARVRLEESQARGELLARAIYQRAREVVPRASDPYAALREDGGLRAILESAIYSKSMTYAAVVNTSGIVVAHYDPEQLGRPLPEAPRLDELVALGGIAQLREIFGAEGRTYEVRQPLRLGDQEFGSIRIGVSTLLVRNDLEATLAPVIRTAIYVLVGATVVALALAQWLLRPIHVLRSGLRRLGRGEPAAALDLPQDEFGELGHEIRAVSDRLLAGKDEAGRAEAGLDAIVEHLADAAGIFGASGEPLFANPTLRSLLAASEQAGVAPFDELIRRTRETRTSAEPVTMTLPWKPDEGVMREWLIAAHPVEDREKRLVGVMVLARDLEALGAVETTIRYSRKLAALGRLTAGVAHEVKNPLNAMTIHLELLKGKLALSSKAADGGPTAAALDHVGVIGSEIRRLDQVVQGFLKFMRPEDLQLQPVEVDQLLGEIARIVEPDCGANGVRVQIDCPDDVPDVQGDPGSLRQALLNLALNACQAMPHGGTLRLLARRASRRRVEIVVEDTGSGIRPEHLPKIFDLYFTTKNNGSGIGLSMVFRTVQLHDGEVEVQSTPGNGTTFRILLPQT